MKDYLKISKKQNRPLSFMECQKLSNDLTETALNNNGLNMAFRHKRLNIFGVQFHPESILTEHGKEILKTGC